MVKKVLIVLSIITTIIVSILMPIASWQQIWIPIVLLIGSFVGYFILYMLFLFIVSLTINDKKEYEKPNKFYRFLLLITMQMLYDMGGAKVKVTGIEEVPTDKRYMLVFNHRSRFDPIIQTYVLRKNNLVHISKPSNFKVPIAGKFMKRCGYLSIDRENSKNGLKTILKAIDLIESGTASVGVSPEGTRNYQDGLLPFRAGCFKITLKAKCPIVVCTMRNTLDIHKNFPFKKTNVEMRIIKVIPYEEFKDMNTQEISEMVRKLMCEDLNIVEE